jgi:hypothetical protein
LREATYIESGPAAEDLAEVEEITAR